MKIRQKIFIGIFLAVAFSMAVFGGVVMYENHGNNLRREQERSCREIDLYMSALQNTISLLENEEAALEWFNRQYQSKGIAFFLYEQVITGKLAAKGGESLTISPDDYMDTILAKPGEEQKCQLVIQKQDKRYLLTSCRMTQEAWPVLMYAREITSVYDQQKENFRQMLLVMMIVLIFSSFLAAVLAKYITAPLEKLKDDVWQMEAGNYVFREIKGHDEIKDLRRSFGKMAGTIQKREEELSRELTGKKDFIAAMTHEMNTPLTSIQGYAQYLKNANCPEEKKRQALMALETESVRMGKMYEKLRQTYLMEGSVPECVEVCFDDLINSVQEELALLLNDKNISIDRNLQVQKLKSDPTLLLLILSNLVKNAAVYSAKGSRIHISTVMDFENYCKIRVRDWGKGIPREKVDKVTEPFYRVDKSRSRATGGTGLGLYLCKQIIEKINGQLEIQSEEGKGTVVTVKLPL